MSQFKNCVLITKRNPTMRNTVFFILVLFVCGYVSSVPLTQQLLHEYDHHDHHKIKTTPIPILKQDFHQHHEGYQYSYETGNGIHVQETGYLKNKGDKKHEVVIQQGTITYHDEHGHPITLTYIADEHGFQPQGAHLPTPPPVPEEIQKSLHDSQQPELHTGHQQEQQEQQQYHAQYQEGQQQEQEYEQY